MYFLLMYPNCGRMRSMKPSKNPAMNPPTCAEPSTFGMKARAKFSTITMMRVKSDAHCNKNENRIIVSLKLPPGGSYHCSESMAPRRPNKAPDAPTDTILPDTETGIAGFAYSEDARLPPKPDSTYNGPSLTAKVNADTDEYKAHHVDNKVNDSSVKPHARKQPPWFPIDHQCSLQGSQLNHSAQKNFSKGIF